MSDYIPQEVVMQILARFPVKSLLGFRCVCKEWYALISDTSFISQHLSHSLSSTNTSVLLKHKCYLETESYSSEEKYTVYRNDIYGGYDTRVLDLPIERFRESPIFVGGEVSAECLGDFPKFVGCCHGVVALYDSKPGYVHVVILWNPSINTYVISQTPEVRPVAVEPCVSRVGFGFGFVSESKDYKFVSVYYLSEYEGRRHGEVLPRVKLFSLLTGEWRTVEYNVRSQSESRINPKYESQVVVDGVVHWSGERKVVKSGGRLATCYVIVKFDLSTEKFGEIVLPETIVDATPRNKVLPIMLRGLFSVVYYNKEINTNVNINYFNIWAMTVYGDANSWTQLYNCKINAKIGRVLGMRRDGKLLLSVRSREPRWGVGGIPLALERGQLMSYNSDNQFYGRTSMYGKKSSFVIDDYVKSLVLLGKGDKVSEKLPDQHQIDIHDYNLHPDPIQRRMDVFYMIIAVVGLVVLIPVLFIHYLKPKF